MTKHEYEKITEELLKEVEATLRAMEIKPRQLIIEDNFSEDNDGVSIPAVRLDDFLCSFMEGKYLIQKEVIFRGVRYRRDGSGEPDDVDYKDMDESSSLFIIVPLLIKAWFTSNLVEVCSGRAEERMYQEEYKDIPWKEYIK